MNTTAQSWNAYRAAKARAEAEKAELLEALTGIAARWIADDQHDDTESVVGLERLERGQ